MNFFDAINTHVGWKVRLQHYLEDTLDQPLDARVVGRDDQCELGHWLNDNQAQFRDMPEFWQLLEDHTAFHRYAGQIIDRTDEGDRAEAERLLHHEYSTLSHRVVQGLRALSIHLDGD